MKQTEAEKKQKRYENNLKSVANYHKTHLKQVGLKISLAKYDMLVRFLEKHSIENRSEFIWNAVLAQIKATDPDFDTNISTNKGESEAN